MLSTVLTAAVASACAFATTPIQLNGQTYPRFSSSPAAAQSLATAQRDTGFEESIDIGPSMDAELAEIRSAMASIRARRRRLQRDLRTLQGKAAEKLRLECEQHGESLARLDDVQRRLLRSATAGLWRERRAAERQWRQWLA